MTLEESLAFYAKLNKQFNADMSNFLINIVQQQQELYASLVAPLESFGNTIVQFTELYSQQSRELAKALSEPLVSIAERMSDIYPSIQSAIRLAGENAISASEAIAESLAYSMSDVIDSAIRYAPEEIQAEYSESISQTLNPQEKRRLSFSDLFALLNFMLALYMAIITTLPNPQLEKLSEQNDQLITIEREVEQNEELIKTISDLSDAIIVLSNEVDTLREQIEDSNNLDQLDEQGDDGDTLQEGSQE